MPQNTQVESIAFEFDPRPTVGESKRLATAKDAWNAMGAPRGDVLSSTLYLSLSLSLSLPLFSFTPFFLLLLFSPLFLSDASSSVSSDRISSLCLVALCAFYFHQRRSSSVSLVRAKRVLTGPNISTSRRGNAEIQIELVAL